MGVLDIKVDKNEVRLRKIKTLTDTLSAAKNANLHDLVEVIERKLIKLIKKIK